MGKLNYSNFDDTDEMMIVPAGSTELIKNPSGENNGSINPVSIITPITNAISPQASFVNICSVAIQTIDNISRYCAMVAIEKQKTKQIKAQASIQIEESKQQTKRIEIQEKEKTKRAIIEYKEEIERRKQELEILRENTRLGETKNDQNRILYTERLNQLHQIIQSIINDKNTILQIAAGGDYNEDVLCKISEWNGQLIEMATRIVQLQSN